MIYWIPVILWMMVIYAASGDQHSMDHSSRIVAPIVKWLFPNMSAAGVAKAVFLARKAAHVTVYAILAILLWIAFLGSFELKPQTWSWKPVFWTLGLVILYAASDEIHQTRVPTRQGTQWDVLIDVSGAALALGGMWIVGRWRRKW